MNCIVNGTPHEIPFDPAIIPLQQYIEFYDQYGRDIDEQMAALEPDSDFDADGLLDKEAAAWFQFHTGYELTTEHAEPFLLQYRLLRYVLHSDGNEYPVAFEWNSEQWAIQAPIVTPASNMTFNEVVVSKYMTEQLRKAGRSSWESFLHLAVVFFRKKDEPFTDELMLPASGRLELMRTMPLQFAISVGFFLSDCVNTWLKTFPYSWAESGKTIEK